MSADPPSRLAARHEALPVSPSGSRFRGETDSYRGPRPGKDGRPTDRYTGPGPTSSVNPYNPASTDSLAHLTLGFGGTPQRSRCALGQFLTAP